VYVKQALVFGLDYCREQGFITIYVRMRRDFRLVVTARPRERRAPHALCVKHLTARAVPYTPL